MNRREFTLSMLTAACAATALPEPLYSLPLQNRKPLLQLQQQFLDLRFGMFIHLNMATYEQREWGDPKASPKLFNPTHLDTDQWAAAAKSAGMAYGCLTTKHHDGFCLWPTATASPSVKDAALHYDIVRAYAHSFRRHGLKVCLYFSILDLRANIRPYDVTPEKIAMIKAQLTELLSNYGEITMIIFDGWNAGWSRIGYDQIPFQEIYDHVKSLQPNCLVTDHNAGRFPVPILYYTDVKEYEQHAGQKIPSDSLVPSQSGTTLQSEWFWKRDYPTQQLRPAHQVVDDWLVPFNQQHCNLILNVAPNPEGRFDPNAVDRLAEIGRLWKNPGPAPRLSPSIQILTPNLAFAQPSYDSSGLDGVGPDLANDNNFSTDWRCDVGQTSGWIEIDFPHATRFNTATLIAPLSADYGAQSRVEAYRLQYWDSAAWVDIATGQNLGSFKIHRFPSITAKRVRITLNGSKESPGIAEFGIYNELGIR
ncbi:MAG TPA: alpha-L-fucosidase [Acidobacteriaceae bacterium]|nr:alpha-L-fucosidase [Acidobacteriaceae bacterium]